MINNGNAISDITINGSNFSYNYNKNGNMTFDGYRGVNIKYNDINLPNKLIGANGNVEYIYDASRQKLAINNGSTNTYYRNNFVYNDNDLLHIVNPDGMIRKVGNNFVYNYLIKDYLGNTRVLLEASGNILTPTQTTEYYPYGLAFNYNNININKYLYNGKELQDADIGSGMLGFYDFGARFYDPIFGRWFLQDPASQLTSPYNFSGNNPITFVDNNGEFFFSALLSGAIISGLSYTLNVSISNEKWGWANFGKSLGFGAISGVLTGGIGEVFGPVGGLGKEIMRGAMHGVSNGMISSLAGGSFKNGFLTGAISSYSGSIFSHYGGDFSNTFLGNLGFSALMGGVSSSLSGGKFMRGMAVGATIGILNHDYHKMTSDELAELQVKAIRAFLKDLGYDPDLVSEYVTKHLPNSEWYTKYAYLNNGDITPFKSNFTDGFFDSVSGDFSAWVSDEITLTTKRGIVFKKVEHYAAKFYPGRDNSIGLMRTRLPHYYEAGMEVFDGLIRKYTNKDNLIYQMHEKNASRYLRYR